MSDGGLLSTSTERDLALAKINEADLCEECGMTKLRMIILIQSYSRTKLFSIPYFRENTNETTKIHISLLLCIKNGGKKPTLLYHFKCIIFLKIDSSR